MQLILVKRTIVEQQSLHFWLKLTLFKEKKQTL